MKVLHIEDTVIKHYEICKVMKKCGVLEIDWVKTLEDALQMVSALEDNLDMLHMIYDSVQVMQGGYIKVKEQNTVKILDENCEVLLSCDESDFLEFSCGYALVRKGNAVELRWGDTSRILDIEPWDIVRNLRILDNNILFECKTRSFNYMECRDWIYIADKQ